MRRVVNRLRHTNREQRKAIFSVGMSLLTRLPGLAGLLWFLPLVRFGLGTVGYAELLSGMALGTASAFCSGGIALIGRRMIGEAYANGDQRGEANSFCSFVVAHALTVSLALAVVMAYCRISGSSRGHEIVSLLTAGGFFLITFDNTRAAFNEHYITATLVIICQTIAFTVGFLVRAAQQNMVLTLFVLQGPYWLANLATFALMLRDRLHLLRGRPDAVWIVLRQGSILGMADGFIMATLSLAVVWLQGNASADVSAWFATLVRLFQTFLVPVTVVLFSLSSYIRIEWKGKTAAEQKAFTCLTLVVALGYGMLVAVGLFVLSQFYVGWLLHLPVPRDRFVFVFFGAIVAYNSYSAVAYIVLDEPIHLASWITAAIGVAVLLGAVVSQHVAPLSAVDTYAVVAGILLIGITSWNAMRFIRRPLEARRLR
jgi:hypothetical protein